MTLPCEELIPPLHCSLVVPALLKGILLAAAHGPSSRRATSRLERLSAFRPGRPTMVTIRREGRFVQRWILSHSAEWWPAGICCATEPARPANAHTEGDSTSDSPEAQRYAWCLLEPGRAIATGRYLQLLTQPAPPVAPASCARPRLAHRASRRRGADTAAHRTTALGRRSPAARCRAPHQ